MVILGTWISIGFEDGRVAGIYRKLRGDMGMLCRVADHSI